MTVSTLTPARPSAGRLGHGATAGSYIFSLSVENDELQGPSQHAEVAAQLELLEHSLLPLLRPGGPFHRKLLHDVMLFHDVMLAEEDEVDGVVLASKLTAAGYRVAVRQALGGGSGVQVFSNLRHSFLLVTAPEPCTCAGIDFIVEPHFREQFEISQPTARYAGLLAMLPSVLVGTAAQLTPLVQLLCSEMSLAFEQHGLSLPPWRQSKSLLSKWLPSKARDFDLSPYSSPRAASPEPLFPLAVITAAAAAYDGLAPISEAASGSITPGGFSGDDASPRAVLHGASAVLMSHQQLAAARGGEAGQAGGEQAAAPVAQPTSGLRKSLLSSSLAASGQRSASPEAQRPQRAASTPLPLLTPPLPMGVALHHGGPSGLNYRVSSEWQQPAIRTVKMQGSAAKEQPK